MNDEMDESEEHVSSTLKMLETQQKQGVAQGSKVRLPHGRTVCEKCPHAVWHVTDNEIRAYCRVMYLISWSTKEQNEIKLCDGIMLPTQ